MKRIRPQPEPRYDDVFYEGVEWLNSLGGLVDPAELRTPDPETIEVLDFDLIFDGGYPLELVLYPDDTLKVEGEVMSIEIAETGELYDIPLSKILFSRKRARTMQKPAHQDPQPAASGAVPPTAASQLQPAIDSLQVLPDSRTDRRG